MTASTSKRCMELLLSSGLVQEQQLQQALAVQRERGGNLTEILVQRGVLEERDWMGVLAERMGLPPLNLSKYRIDPSVVKLIPERLAREYRLIAVSKIGERLVVAMADPLNVLAADDIKALTRYDLDIVVSGQSDILRAIDQYYQGDKEKISELVDELDRTKATTTTLTATAPDDIQGTVAASKEAPIVRMVDLIIQEGLRRHASDIHLEPQEYTMQVRYRVDGLLQEAYQIPKAQQNAILVRLEIMAGVNITEWRLPQDGRFRMRTNDREIDFRFSILPITHGGKVVLRILDQSSLKHGLGQLGFSPDLESQFQQAVASPYGMILVTGPTGSGKSTTLYAALSQLNTPDRNIMTIEDPVEYQLEGITQLQVQPEIGLTFATGLRAMLRQTPDIIMVGEIRDAETADIATKASLTGQIVLSTLHTNDAAGAVTRLIDMGVEPFLVASGVIAVAAQRLCRQLCQRCREPYTPEPALQSLIHLPAETPLYRAAGCASCRNSGYAGRMGLLELLMIDDTVRDMIIREATAGDIRAYATQHGMTLLRDDGMRKVREGQTSYEEVTRVTVED